MIKPFGAKAARFIRRPPEQDARLNLLDGSTGASKTWAVNAKLIAALSQGYWPGGIGLISGNSKQSVKTNILNDVFNIVGDNGYRYNQQSGELKLLGRRFLVCGAKDEGSWKAIRGSTVGIWVADEVTLYPQSFFNMAVTRLRLPGSRMWGTTNPGTPFHYLKTDYIDNEEKRRSGDFWYEHLTLDDNPNLSDETKDFLRRQFTGVFRLRYIDGIWCVAEGSIYRDSWDEKVVLYNPEDEPIGLRGQGGYKRRHIAIDYGTRNACVFGDWYDDGQTCWLVREYYWDSVAKMRQKTDAEYVDDLMEFIGTQGRGVQVIVDPSAASLKVEMKRRGLWISDAKNDVSNGIKTTSAALSAGLIKINRRDCPMVCQQMPTYAWDEKAAQHGEEKPIKENDHGPDMVRYYCETVLNPWRIAQAAKTLETKG